MSDKKKKHISYRPTVLPPEVREGQSVELLKALHILTRDGQLNQDSRRKLKQVYHLYQFIEPLLQELADAAAQHPRPTPDAAGRLCRLSRPRARHHHWV